MSDKIQMTEEQARKFFVDIFFDYFDCELETLAALNIAKEKGYIIKSDLKQKVEEAEEMFKYWQSNGISLLGAEKLMIKQHEAIRLLKQSHPEFKK